MPAVVSTMSRVRVRVLAAGADPTNPGVEVELPPAPAGWAREHTDSVANAVGVDSQSVCVSLRFADGTSEGLPAGRGGWLMVKGMEPGDVLVVGSGAGVTAAPATPAAAALTMPLPRRTGTNPCSPAEGVPLPEEEQNSKRLNLLFLSGTAEVRKALQQVRKRHLLPVPFSLP